MDRFEFDEQYVTRLKYGDPETEHHFSLYFNDRLLAKLRGRLRSAQAIEDARQETFLRVLGTLRRNGLEHPERLGAFVLGVCNNVLLEHYRGEKRTTPIEDSPEPVDERDNPDGLLVTEERKSLVRKGLEDLPARDRALLEEIFLRERDKDEVCAEFQVSRDYLRVLLFRARKRFREGDTGRAAGSAR